MGRWSQNRRTGGGPPGVGLLSIIEAFRDDLDLITLTYNGTIAAAAFAANEFTCTPSSTIGEAVSQVASNKIQVDFTDAIDTDTDLTYDGSNPAVTSPQTIEITF